MTTFILVCVFLTLVCLIGFLVCLLVTKLDQPKPPVKHWVSYSYYSGTGRGDDQEGWKCSCGMHGTSSSSAVSHIDQAKIYEALNG